MRDHDYSSDTMSRDRRDNRRARFRDSSRPPGALFDSDDRRDRDDGRYGINRRSGDPYGERDPKFGSDAYHEGFPKDETERLIASNKVEGTPVYGRNGERLGSVHNFMVDKYSGEVVYAVMKSSSGFLGLGERYYMLDWCDLTYDRRAQGYGVEMTEDDLERRDSYDAQGRRIESRRRGSAHAGRGRRNDPYRYE